LFQALCNLNSSIKTRELADAVLDLVLLRKRAPEVNFEARKTQCHQISLNIAYIDIGFSI